MKDELANAVAEATGTNAANINVAVDFSGWHVVAWKFLSIIELPIVAVIGVLLVRWAYPKLVSFNEAKRERDLEFNIKNDKARREIHGEEQ